MQAMWDWLYDERGIYLPNIITQAMGNAVVKGGPFHMVTSFNLIVVKQKDSLEILIEFAASAFLHGS